MTRGEAIKDFFYKTILPVAAAALLYCIFRSACVKNGELDYLWLWNTLRVTVRHLAAAPLDHTGRRLSGRRDRPVCAEPHFAGIIGGFVLAWRLIVAAWYVQLTVWKLIRL